MLVEGQRIAAVQRGGGLPRGDARVIDGAGATLMPGLIEPHGHVSYPDAARNSDFTRLPPEEHILVTMRNAKTMLDCGYTSVLSAASAKPRLDVVVRNEIEAGRIPGPRYLANGPEITVTGGLGDENPLHLPHLETPTFAWVADGPDEIRRVCRLLVREGVDLLKLNLSGDTGPRNSRSERAVMTRRRGGGGHGGRARRRRARVRARPQRGVGQDVRAPRHRASSTTPTSPTRRRSTCSRPTATGASWAPPSASPTRPATPASEWGFTPEMARERGLVRELEVAVDTMGQMRKRGIRVLPGGDYGFAWNPHGTYARDLLLFVDVLGFSPMETLVAATRLGGEIMGRGRRAGPGQAGLPRRPPARGRRSARRHQAPAATRTRCW